MRVSSKHVAFIIFFTFIVAILASTITGYWATESSKTPRLIQSGAFAGTYDPADIRGSYSFDDVSRNFDIPIDVLQKAFMIPTSYDIHAFQNKTLESLYAVPEPGEIGNGSVKLFVALYAGLPYPYESSGDYLPLSAFEILVDEDKLSEDQSLYLQPYLIDLTNLSLNNVTAKDTEVSTENSEEHDASVDRTVKGKTMFKDVLDMGITQDEIESILGIAMGHPLEEIRTYCQEHSIEFQVVKSALQSKIDALE